MKTKLFTFLLAMMASMGTMRAVVYSGSCGAEGNNLLWSLDSEDGVLTISGIGKMANYDSQYNLSPWYDYHDDIESVNIEDGVTSIGGYAFSGCNNLSSVTISNSIINIYYWAFRGCSSLTSITIPNSVTSIEQGIFSTCNSLTSIIVEAGNSVYDSRNNCNAIIQTASNTLIAGCQNTTIPNSVTSIGWYAFTGCNNLSSITIPNSVTSIGSDAFNGCFSLTSLTIPSSVTSIGWDAFSMCYGLTSIIVEAGNSVYDSRNNCNAIIQTASNTLIAGCQNTTIPNSVTSIRWDAFYGCKNLSAITIPNSIISIGSRAFSSCSGLTSVTNYATTPQTINADVFRYVDLSNCTLYVPAQSLAAYQVADVWKDFGTILAIGEEPCTTFSGTCGENLTWELTCDSVLTISGTGAMWRLTEEQAWRPYKEQIKTAILPEGLDSIAPKAFYQCVNLTSVNLPNSVRALGTKAFVECYKLAEPVYNERIFAFLPKDYSSTYSVPEGIVSVAAYAISYLLPTAESNAIPSSLKEIVLPSSLKRLGISSLAGAQLEKITCYATTPPVCAQSVFDYYYDEVEIVLHSIDRSIPVYVPAESVEAYKAANQWSSFFNILPIEKPIETVEADFNVLYTGHDDNELSSEFITLHVPVAPEIEGFTFLKWQVVAGDLEDGIVIEAVYTADAPLSAPAIYTDPANPAQKLIRDGNVYILKGNKTYTITGQEVK